MGFLLSCWFVTENVLLPQGFSKWYRLSFFIHPFFLVICQCFLFITSIGSYVLVLVSFLCQVTWNAVVLVCQYVRNCIHIFFPVSELDDVSVVISNAYEAEQDATKTISVCGQSVVPIIYGPGPLVEDWQGRLEEEEDEEKKSNSEVVGNLYSQNSSSQLSNFTLPKCGPRLTPEDQEELEESEVNTERDQDIDGYSAPMGTSISSALISNSAILMLEDEPKDEKEVGEADIFYKNYNKRMLWFDQLNAERRYAVSVILNKKLDSASLSECIEPMDFSLLEVASKELARSLESDFEVIYVGQASLGWEALRHQYRKVEMLACSNNAQESLFPCTMAGKFQQFQVLLERFVENERHQGKRFWNYAHTRFSLKQLLQVPEVSGYVEGAGGELNRQAINARELLEAIEKAIKAFWVFLKAENKKYKGLLERLSSMASPVEDPMDLGLLTILSKEAHKIKVRLKDLQKKRRWPMGTKPYEGDQNIELFFCMIDIKLISRVLKMSVITTEQLKWCQEKLNTIEFKQGKAARTLTGCLFPCS